MKDLFTTALLIITAIWLVITSWDTHEAERPNVVNTEVRSNWLVGMGLGELPDNNYYSGSLTEKDIRQLALAGIHTIIRLNGNKGRDRGHLSIPQERRLCESLGIQFLYFNIEGSINNTGAIVADLMQNGFTLVHCRNGAHRAPCMATFYLKEKKMPVNEIITVVGWTDLIKKPGRYDRYTSVLGVKETI